MKFLVDRCAGRRLTDWLNQNGHDALHVANLVPDPGDALLLQIAATENRVLITIDTDFGTLAFRDEMPHSGIIRLPDVPSPHKDRHPATTYLKTHN